jgi:serine/threonine protein kinase
MQKTVDKTLNQGRILRQPSRTRPVLWLIDLKGRQVVVKDYSVNRFLYRHLVGRFLIWRESKAYRRLRGLKGVPKYYGKIAGPALVLEAVPAESVENLEKVQKLPEEFFKTLRTLVDAFHQRGLAHCDLKRAPNILLGDDAQPYIVDWSAAITFPEFRFFPFNLIYQRFVLDDLNAVIKLQLRHCPQSLSPAELKRYFQRSRMERLIRKIRDRSRELLQKIA